MGEFNFKAFEEVLNYIKEHPSEWDQNVWHCGTSHCMAGHLQVQELLGEQRTGFSFDVLLAGLTGKGPHTTVPTCELGLDEKGKGHNHYAGYKYEGASYAATRILNISKEESEWLFSFQREIADFERFLEEKKKQCITEHSKNLIN